MSVIIVSCCLLTVEYKLSDAHGQASAIRRGAVFASHGKHEAAAREFTLALSHPGNEFKLRMVRGKEYLLLHRYQNAEKDFKYSLTLEPKNADAQHFLALTKKLQDRPDNVNNNETF